MTVPAEVPRRICARMLTPFVPTVKAHSADRYAPYNTAGFDAGVHVSVATVVIEPAAGDAETVWFSIIRSVRSTLPAVSEIGSAMRGRLGGLAALVKQDATDAGDHRPTPLLELRASVVVQIVELGHMDLGAALAAKPCPRDRASLASIFTAAASIDPASGAAEVRHRRIVDRDEVFMCGPPPSP